MNQINEVWVFNGANGRFPSAVFTNKKYAEDWISKHMLYGILTLYPLNQSVYDWAITINILHLNQVKNLLLNSFKNFRRRVKSTFIMRTEKLLNLALAKTQ